MQNSCSPLYLKNQVSTICFTNGIKITVDQSRVAQQCFPHPYIHSCYRQDIERDLIPERNVKEISQATKIKDLYFGLLKSSKKEIMLIFPSNKAFGQAIKERKSSLAYP